jgi:hypothetical protein
MKRRLSSRWTFFWKVIFPATWTSGMGFATFSLFIRTVDDAGKPNPVWAKWLFLTIWLLGSASMLKLVIPLKRVARDENTLYVSNYRVEVAIALSSIQNVRENRRIQIGGKHPIIIELAADSPYGKQIVFIPTGKAPFAWPWQKKPHPIAAELQNMLDERNRAIRLQPFDKPH